MIASKRLQQAIFNVGRVANRTNGSAAGSGQKLYVSGFNSNQALGQTVSSGVGAFTTITGSTITVNPGKPSTYLMMGSSSIRWNSGANPLILSIFVDGVQEESNGTGPAGSTTWMTCPVMYVASAIGVGSHTFDMRASAGGGNYSLSNFEFWVVELG